VSEWLRVHGMLQRAAPLRPNQQARTSTWLVIQNARPSMRSSDPRGALRYGRARRNPPVLRRPRHRHSQSIVPMHALHRRERSPLPCGRSVPGPIATGAKPHGSHMLGRWIFAASVFAHLPSTRTVL
jgi:hypothetical protein